MRTQLSISLAGVISQQLLPRRDGKGRVPAAEVLIATHAVRNLKWAGVLFLAGVAVMVFTLLTHTLFAFAESYEMLLASRMAAGIFGATIATIEINLKTKKILKSVFFA